MATGMAEELDTYTDEGSLEEEEAIVKSWRSSLQVLSGRLEELESSVRREEEEKELATVRGYKDEDKQRLTQLVSDASSLEGDLCALMEAPQLKEMREADEDTPTHVAAREVFGQTQTLQLSAQDLSRRLENLANSSQGHSSHKDDFVLRDFEALEAWLQQAYDTIFQEPSRHLYPPSLVDEDILRSYSQSSIYTEGEGEKTASRTASAQNGSVAAAENTGVEGGSGEAGVDQCTGEAVNDHVNGQEEGEEGGAEGANEEEAELVGVTGEDSEDISPTESGETEEGEGVSSEWTQSGSEVESLGWVRALHIMPMVHVMPQLPTPPPTSPSSTSTSSSLWDTRRGSAADVDLNHLLTELQKLSKELPIQSQKVKKIKANVLLATSSLPAESAGEYRSRLTLLLARWDLLEAELATRIAELSFEKEQKNILESMHEAVNELEGQPLTNMLQDVVEERYNDLLDFIISIDQFEAMKTDQVQHLQESLEILEGLNSESEDKERWRELTDSIVQGYEAVARRVREQKLFLERCRELWTNFERCHKSCCDWLDRAEQLVSKESYGYTLKDTQTHLTEIRDLKQTIQMVEEKGAELVSVGKTMLVGIDEGSDAEQYVEDRLSGMESRLEELITPTKGKIETRESAIEKVIRDWETYNNMVTSTHAFISQMTKMVGPEPKDSSHGNSNLIPTYVAYRNQIQSMEASYKRLVSMGSDLAADPHIECRSLFADELKDLQAMWGPLKDNVADTLDIFIREYNDWIMVKLQHMNDLVNQGQALVQQAERFVQSYPLEDIMKADSSALLKESDQLVSNMEKLSTLEGECAKVEEQLLEKQIQQETAVGFSGSQSDLEYSTTTEEKDRVMAAREQVQADWEGLQPVLNVMYLQLQLLQGVQECVEIINDELDFVGSQKACDDHLINLEEELSSDRFDKLKGQAYDVGTVLEEAQEEAESLEQPSCFPKENYDKMLTTNRTLGAKIDTLLSSSEEAKTRLQVIVQWWEEFHKNHSEVGPWLEGVEVDLSELARRYTDDQSPRYSPIILLQQLNSLSAEVEEKSVVVCAIESTSGNILEEMSLKGVNPDNLPQQVEFVRAKWEELRERIRHLLLVMEPSAEAFQTFLSQMSKFLTWLSTYYARVYDEFCMKVPSDASQELIGQMMNQLEVFRAELIKKQPEQKQLWEESEKWAEFKVPEEVLSELPSPPEISPDPPAELNDEEDERSSASLSDTPPLPFVKTCMEKGSEKWWRVRQMLEDREAELERCSGSYQLFSQQAEKLLQWLQEKLSMNALGELPADLGVVEGFHKEVKVTRAELEMKLATLRALQHMGSELRGQVNAASITHLENMLEQMEQVWEKVQTSTETRHEVLAPLVEHLREFTRVSSKFESWLKEKDAALVECGPIGANLDRCLEQEKILADLYEMFMSNKHAPEEVLKEVEKIRGLCGAESEAQVRQKVLELEGWFNSMFEDAEERIERCEQAKAGMQKLLKEIKKFEEWVEQMEETLEKKKAVKRPIGTVQTEIDEHYDFMREVEMHTDEYCVLVPPGVQLMEEYQPNDWLANVMETLKGKWFGYVDHLVDRECVLASLLKKWERYEGEVKELLSWIMSEAESFSKDVTTYGEKGIVDHMETCKNFMQVLEGKKDHIDDIEDQAVVLKVDDAEKKNGTSDVESRWNDVQMHWNSSCKLLTETLLHLEATESEMRHVLQIRGEEFEWLEECEIGAALRRRTHGDLDLLHQEIERHAGLFEEAQDHEEAKEFILSTVPFLVEHSRIADREDIAVKAEDFSSRYKKLRDSLDTHISMLRNSVPFWEKFNSNSKDLEKWLEGVNNDLVSDKVQFGNALVTEQSLMFCQGLQVDINTRNPDLVGVVMLGEELAKYAVPEDVEFVTGFVQRLQKEEKHVTEETIEKTEQLEERLKSWRVFPVEEARVVQEVLNQVKEEEQDGGEDTWDDLSSEELLERLEKLESLRELQSSNEDKVQTIDQSARSEDVQRALQKNPDISKERTNLLQGWSSVSGSLKERIMVTKRKAQLVQQLEHAAKECEGVSQQYQDYLDTPLPPSVLLARSYEDLIQGLIPWHNDCQSSVSSFRSVVQESHEAVESVPGVSVPKHFDHKVTSYQDRLSGLADLSAQWKARIMEIVASWEEFSSDLEELGEWLQSQSMELESLQVLEEFANEFSSHQARLSILKDDFESHRPTFTSVEAASARHITGEEPEVQDVKRRFTRVETSWHKVDTGISELSERSRPWVEFTDKFDEFCVWLSRLEKKVQLGEKEVDQMAEEDGGDLSDKIVLFKGYLIQVDEQECNLTAIKEGAELLLPPEICTKYEECERLQEECEDIADKWGKMKRRLEQNLKLLDQKEVAWKKHAKHSILLASRLQQDMEDYERKLRDKDATIERLRNAPPPPRPLSPRPGSPICRRCVPVILVVVVGLALALVFIKKEEAEFRPL